MPVRLRASPAPYTPIPKTTMVRWWKATLARTPRRVTFITGITRFCAWFVVGRGTWGVGRARLDGKMVSGFRERDG